MLKTSEFKKNQVVCFKLVSGEEVIGKVKSDETDSIVITSARTLVAMQNGAGLAPIASMGSPDTEIGLAKQSVMFTYMPQKEIENKYTQEVSNIKVADSAQQSKIIS